MSAPSKTESQFSTEFRPEKITDKFVKLYDMFLAKFYAKKALNRGDIGDSAHFNLRVVEIAAKSEDPELMKVAVDLLDSEY